MFFVIIKMNIQICFLLSYTDTIQGGITQLILLSLLFNSLFLFSTFLKFKIEIHFYRQMK